MVYDHNSILSDELLGYFSLPAAHAVEAGQQALERGQAATPQWHTVTLSGNPGHSPSTSDARVLASFVLLPSPSRTAAPRSPGFVDRMLEMPAMRSVLLEVNVIGLRGPLKPYAGFPISSTSVRVSLGAFDDSLQVAETGQSSSPSGASPNFFQVLKMSVKCPEQPIFCPTLRCDVIEHRIGGSAVHNIGTAFVPLARYLPWSAPSAEEDDTHAHDRLGKTTSPRVQTLPSTRSPPSSSAASSSSATGAVNGASREGGDHVENLAVCEADEMPAITSSAREEVARRASAAPSTDEIVVEIDHPEVQQHVKHAEEEPSIELTSTADDRCHGVLIPPQVTFMTLS
ncbi:hypothetical protein CYMTET_3373 [Cymbomonas tetramitiformis]|uniref:C2 domain-containing protein n=1 Tax=Cymbomonas tetramitiformis TaxID=36881 RepID=A0AAE0H3T7_9CHLO|nr:hypothetical protein CYMTET_3373 [Cymbomonas tetramitiformis]